MHRNNRLAVGGMGGDLLLSLHLGMLQTCARGRLAASHLLPSRRFSFNPHEGNKIKEGIRANVAV